MTVTTKYTTTAVSAEVARRAERYMTEKGCDYREAMHATLANDKQLAQAYAQPATRRARMATADPRSKPAISVPANVEREIKDWIARAVNANMAGVLPGALGQLSVEADAFKKLGMPVEEAVQRAVDLFPHLRDLAGIRVRDIRRNAPKAPTETAASQPGDVVHERTQALIGNHPHLDYGEALGTVLSQDPALKAAYAGVAR